MSDLTAVLAIGIAGLQSLFTVGYLSSAIALTPTYLFPTIGEIYAEHSGVMNIGIEGIMILGAFLGFYGHHQTGSPTVGLLLAALGGMILAGVVAYLCVTLLLDQIVVGLGVFLAGAGLASYLNTILYPGGTPSRLENPITPMRIPVLADIPVLGEVLFRQNLLVYLSVVLTLVSSYVLYRTHLGREIRSVGEAPDVANSLGVDVYRTRYMTILIGGALAGVGGAYLAQVVAGRYSRLLVGGRGFIVIGIVIVSVWGPRKALIVVLLFSLLDSFGTRIQSAVPDFPVTLIAALPFVATIIMLVLIRGFNLTRQQMPNSLTENYQKGSE
jgi:simple sugar transport system permease protein